MTRSRNDRRWILWGLLLVLAAVQVVIELTGGVQANVEVFQTLGLSLEGMKRGWLWQLMSHGLLHGNVLHFLINGVALYWFGKGLLHQIPLKKWWIIFLGGVLYGGAAFLVVDALKVHVRQGNCLVGISGGLMALFTTFCYLNPESRSVWLRIRAKHLATGMIVASALLVLINPLLRMPVFGSAGRWLESVGAGGLFLVSHACHLGGCLMGLLGLRIVYGKMITLDDLRKERARNE